MELIKKACDAYARGQLIEPRVFYYSFTMPITSVTPQAVRSAEGAFRNGEAFPVRITHLTMSERRLASGDSVLSENLRSIRIKLIRHNQSYFSNYHALSANWANVHTTPPMSLMDFSTQVVEDTVQASTTVAWNFERPVILAPGETFKVEIGQRIATVADATKAGLSFHAFGVLSRKPYIFSGERLISATGPKGFNASMFTNEANEAVCLTGLTVYAGVLSEGQGTVHPSLVRDWTIMVERVGNVSRRWFKTSQVGAFADVYAQQNTDATRLMPAELLGVSMGSRPVHRFPGEGILLEPGAEVVAEILATVNESTASTYDIGLCGYIEISS